MYLGHCLDAEGTGESKKAVLLELIVKWGIDSNQMIIQINLIITVVCVLRECELGT